MVNWTRRKKNNNQTQTSQDTSAAQSFFILSRLPQLLTGLHFTVSAAVAASVAVPPAWVHLPSKGRVESTPSGSAGENLWQQDSYVPVLMDQSKVRSRHPWINLWGAVHSQTVHAQPMGPSRRVSASCICATSAPGSFAPDTLLLSISSDSGMQNGNFLA